MMNFFLSLFIFLGWLGLAFSQQDHVILSSYDGTSSSIVAKKSITLQAGFTIPSGNSKYCFILTKTAIFKISGFFLWFFLESAKYSSCLQMADVKVKVSDDNRKQLAIGFVSWRRKEKHQLFTVNAQSEKSHGQEWWGFAGHKCARGLSYMYK
ncbi:hypothetical protein [Sphingobacterium hotanense]|uniref:hypothetical protein n=1 Tax=Sphingobacterium hotanense TaxID=649196 RepID=UPI0021A36477|nr:hypothetical protein [Sphingobacterium hotanense]MCT1526432.1 hypothetical protein [Sphingobacterium hotanense]